MAFLQSFKEFFKPEDYKNKPYPYLTNQMGHVFLGFTITVWYSWILRYFSGVYPSQTMSFAMCVLVYLCVWELACQGWRKFDTIEDTAYFGIGSSVFLFIHMEFVLDRVAAYLVLLSIPLALGTIRRINASKE